MLQDIDIDVVALLNDTVGTLMALGYTDQRCQIGVIVGTGSNACYLERVDRCPKLEGIADGFSEEVDFYCNPLITQQVSVSNVHVIF